MRFLVVALVVHVAFGSPIKATCPSASNRARVEAYVHALGSKDPQLASAQFIANGTVWSTSEGRKSPPSAFFGSFLPGLVTAKSELLEIWCPALAETTAARLMGTFRFTFTEQAGQPEEGGIYMDEFFFEPDSGDGNPLLNTVKMFENKFIK